MVTLQASRRAQLAIITMMASTLACDPTVPLASHTNKSMVYLVLSLHQPAPAQPGIFAVVANTGTPYALDLRPATRLVLRRRSDLATFAWRPATPQPPGFVRGNYELLESSTPDGLGWRNLVPGERYDLEVETEGRLVAGSTQMPERPMLRLQRGLGIDTVFWNRAIGAVAYRFLDRNFEVDTFFVVAPRADTATYYVTAFEQNLHAYLRDTTLVRSGITGAFGLFGAQVTAAITVPGTRP